MKITFVGATHEVTGSCYFLEAAGKKCLANREPADAFGGDSS